MEKIVRISEYIGLVFVIILSLLTVSDVAGRYFFNSPVRGGLEMTELLLGCMVAFALIVVTNRGEHIVIDTLVGKLSRSVQRAVLMVTNLFSVLLFAIFTWQGTLYSLQSMEKEEFTPVLEIPIYPFKFLFFFGGFLTLLVVVIQTVRSFRHIRG